MELTFVYLVGIVMGVTEVVKRVGISGRYAPALSLIFGVIGGYFFFGGNVQGIAQGIVAGLTAPGIWSGVKTTTK